MTAYTWTTGPVNGQAGADCVQMTISNDSASTRKVFLKLYDLAFTPKKVVVSEAITLKPYGSAFITIPLRRVCNWEIRYKAYSRKVRATITERGRCGAEGTTVLSKDFILLNP